MWIIEIKDPNDTSAEIEELKVVTLLYQCTESANLCKLKEFSKKLNKVMNLTN